MDTLEHSAHELMDNKRPVDPETTRRAKIIEVIETVSVRGNGANTVFREVIQYWSKDGILLAENDPCNNN